MAIHKLRSLGASILLILILGVLSYILLTEQYEELLGKYPTQGDRAYVLAFIDIFLYDLLSTSFLLVALPTTFLLGLILLRNWKDSLLSGLMSGIVVSLLALYVMKNYFPEELAAGGITLVLQRIWQGSVNGLIIGAPGAFGGSLGSIGGLIKKRRITKQPATKRPYRCPECGVEFESNPEFCSNCGKRIRRASK
nr:hypothetical protein [Candidatus Njordarchaeum guaymaensis]